MCSPFSHNAANKEKNISVRVMHYKTVPNLDTTMSKVTLTKNTKHQSLKGIWALR